MNFNEAYQRNCQSQSFHFEACSRSKRRGRGEAEAAKNRLKVPRGKAQGLDYRDCNRLLCVRLILQRRNARPMAARTG